MDFFRSILTEDDPESTSNNQQSDTDPQQQEEEYYDDDDSNSNVNSSEDGSTTGGLWSFGEIVKTLTKSESVFETYRRDLKEFGSGLRKESDLFREVASRAVKELPDIGTSVIKTTRRFIKSSNIVLYPFEAVKDRVQTQPGFARGLSDGLPKIIIAPEYISTGRSSEITNVYGYGVMLLELNTGKQAYDLGLQKDDSVMLLD